MAALRPWKMGRDRQRGGHAARTGDPARISHDHRSHSEGARPHPARTDGRSCSARRGSSSTSTGSQGSAGPRSGACDRRLRWPAAAKQLDSAAAQAREVEEITREGALTYRARYLPDLVSYRTRRRATPRRWAAFSIRTTSIQDVLHTQLVATRAIGRGGATTSPTKRSSSTRTPRLGGASTGSSLAERTPCSVPGARCSRSDDRTKRQLACRKRARCIRTSAPRRLVGRVDDALARATSVSA